MRRTFLFAVVVAFAAVTYSFAGNSVKASGVNAIQNGINKRAAMMQEI